MNIQRFAKQDIALRQLETALELFFRQGDPFSIITLAGAAEEILGQLLLERADGQGVRGTLNSIFRILRPGNPKEGSKAGLSGHEVDSFVHLDPDQEAVFLLGRAIEDYLALTGKPSAGMVKFLQREAAKPAGSGSG